MDMILRDIDWTDVGEVPKEVLDRHPEIKPAHGAIEQFDFEVDDDGYHVHLVRTIWSRNKRRAVSDQRDHLISRTRILTVTAQQAVSLANQLSGALLWVDGKGPKKEGDR
jgi:hypothetical protein